MTEEEAVMDWLSSTKEGWATYMTHAIAQGPDHPVWQIAKDVAFGPEIRSNQTMSYIGVSFVTCLEDDMWVFVQDNLAALKRKIWVS